MAATTTFTTQTITPNITYTSTYTTTDSNGSPQTITTTFSLPPTPTPSVVTLDASVCKSIYFPPNLFPKLSSLSLFPTTSSSSSSINSFPSNPYIPGSETWIACCPSIIADASRLACDSVGRIMAVNLSHLNLLNSDFPTLPPNFLTTIQLFDVSGNNLIYAPDLTHFSNLSYVDLSNNYIDSTLPELLANKTSLGLTYFNASFNRLAGSIPPFGEFFTTRLQYIDVSDNCFNDTGATSSYQALQSLTSIFIHQDAFCPPKPRPTFTTTTNGFFSVRSGDNLGNVPLGTFIAILVTIVCGTLIIIVSVIACACCWWKRNKLKKQLRDREFRKSPYDDSLPLSMRYQPPSSPSPTPPYSAPSLPTPPASAPPKTLFNGQSNPLHPSPYHTLSTPQQALLVPPIEHSPSFSLTIPSAPPSLLQSSSSKKSITETTTETKSIDTKSTLSSTSASASANPFFSPSEELIPGNVSRDIRAWSTRELVVVLRAHGIPDSIVLAFIEGGVTGHTLLTLTRDNLKVFEDILRLEEEEVKTKVVTLVNRLQAEFGGASASSVAAAATRGGGGVSADGVGAGSGVANMVNVENGTAGAGTGRWGQGSVVRTLSVAQSSRGTASVFEALPEYQP